MSVQIPCTTPSDYVHWVIKNMLCRSINCNRCIVMVCVDKGELYGVEGGVYG